MALHCPAKKHRSHEVSFVCRYLNDNASVDAISSKLREVCPNLYRIEDAACSKVTAV
jgi:hypothetical protein